MNKSFDGQPDENANSDFNTFGARARLSPSLETTAIDPGLAQEMPKFSTRHVLRGFQAKFPYMPVIPIPTSFRNARLAAGVVGTLNLPENTVAVLLLSPQPFWCSLEGNAGIPASDESPSFIVPAAFPVMFYVFGTKQISLFCEQANNVTALCYVDVPKEPC